MDKGLGITTQHLERVFEPFFTTKEVGKGSGLGLSMVYGFVSQCQGFITIESQLALGTSVSIYLPQTDQPIPATRQKQLDDEPEQRIEEPILILTVEDDRELLNILQEILQELGYQMVSATNARQALDVLSKKPEIQLVFSDIVMPGGMNGFELAKVIAKQYPSLPVILTSGYTEELIDSNDSIARSLPILYKPYQRHALAKILKSALEGRHPKKIKNPVVNE
jgi:CheY-like chemotaxis protein